MKKSLSAILVIALSFIGATSLASQFDQNMKSNITETADKKGTDNERTSGACRTKNGN